MWHVGGYTIRLHSISFPFHVQKVSLVSFLFSCTYLDTDVGQRALA